MGKNTTIGGDVLRIVYYRDSRDPTIAALVEAGVPYKEILPPAGLVMASGLSFTVLKQHIPALAGAIGRFLQGFKTRRVMIDIKNQMIDVQNFDAKETEKLLRQAKSIVMIETKAPPAARKPK